MHQQASQSLVWIFQQVKPYRFQLIIAAILTIISSALSFVALWMIYKVSALLIESETLVRLWEETSLLQFGWLALIAAVARYPLSAITYILTHKAAYATLYDIRSHLLLKLHRIQMGYFNNEAQGNLKKILAEDVERIELFIAHHLPDLLTALITPLLGLILLAWVDWSLALACLLPLPLALWLQKRMFRNFEHDFKDWHHGLEALNSTMLQYIQGMPVIRAFNLSAEKGTQLQHHIDQHHQLLCRWTRSSATCYAGLKISTETGLLILIPLGCGLFAFGLLDLATLILFLLVGGALFEPLHNLLMFGGMLSRILQGVERIRALQQQPEIQITSQSESTQHPEQGFVLTNLHFRFPNQQHAALNNINCEFAKGRLTAIVGPSGSGKSTLARMLMRFYEPDQGEISLQGQPLSCYSSATLAELIAVVFQESYLLNDSVYENIAMAKAVPADKVHAAASAAQADAFIRQLTDHYNTQLGDGGQRLSGGEKQRVAIARAILKDAPFIILDEATAFADANNEALVQHALSELLQDKTVIVIAHRLSSIRHADQILVMDEGHIVGQGQHQDLLKRCSIYQQLWQRQQVSQEWSLTTSKATDINADSPEHCFSRAH